MCMEVRCKILRAVRHATQETWDHIFVVQIACDISIELTY